MLTLLLSAITISVANPASESKIYFKLGDAEVGPDGLPKAEWSAALFPVRDASQPTVEVRKIALPMNAASDPHFKNIFTINLSSSTDSSRQLKKIQTAQGVLWAEFAPVRYTDKLVAKESDRIDALPDDPFYYLQWYLDKIYAPAAWDVSRGDTNITIAIIDIGTDIRHLDLRGNVWVNVAERYGTAGVDDDGNGYIDDVNGWDFFDDDPDPRPRTGDAHGTHVAGIACAGTDNGFGIAGIGWNCRYMPIRAGTGRTITNGFEGLIYAAANGADIANLSWGSENISQIEHIAVQYATDKGCLVVAAAGNLSGSNSFDHYPGAYEEVLSVASTDDFDRRSIFSNSESWVDISAPGSKILSLYPDGSYGIEDGTSMASPLVAGAVGLLKAVHPDWSPARLKKQIEATANPIDALNPTYAGKLGSGRLNIYRALAESNADVVIRSVRIVEPTGDGIVDPGERIEIYFDLYNPLSKTANFSIRMTSDSPLISIDNITLESLQIEPNQSWSNENRPFRARVSINCANNSRLKCNLEVSGIDREVSKLPFEVIVRKAWETVRNESVALTVADMGSIGYNDYVKGDGIGEGFRFPAEGLSALFHGSLMIGASGNRVSDNAYGNDRGNSLDFKAIQHGVAISAAGNKHILTSHFNDDDADTLLGVEVWQTTSVLLDTSNNNFALLEYAISLQNGFMPLDSLYVGLYLDWDILTADQNWLYWDSDNELGWMEFGTSHDSPETRSKFGVGIVGNDAAYYAGVNRSDVNRQWDDGDKSNIFRSGFSRADGREYDDWAQMIGLGPTALAVDETLRVAFALVGGESMAQLRAGLTMARQTSGHQQTTLHIVHPDQYGLVSVYPSPFNSRTTVLCRLQRGSEYRWTLNDVLGRTAIDGKGIVSRDEITPILIEGNGLSGGYYIFRINSDNTNFSRPLILLK